MKILLGAILLVSCLAAAAAAQDAGGLENMFPSLSTDPDTSIADWMKANCPYNVLNLPKPGSLAGFMGTLQRANTVHTSYAYYKFGNGNSNLPPLVLISGLGRSLTAWPPAFLKDLAQYQTVVVYDNPGIGLSDIRKRPPRGMTLQWMAEDAVEFFKRIGLVGEQKPNIMGTSLGGCVALSIAARLGRAVERVALIPGNAGSSQPDDPPYQLLKQLMAGRISQLSIANLSFPIYTPEGSNALCDQLWQQSGANQHPGDPDTFRTQIEALAVYWVKPDVTSLLSNVTNRMLLVGGQLDELMPQQKLVTISNQVSTPWLAMYPGAAHGAAFQERDTFLPLLRAFLKSP